MLSSVDLILRVILARFFLVLAHICRNTWQKGFSKVWRIDVDDTRFLTVELLL